MSETEPMSDLRSINIPFEGFYESNYSSAVDREEEQEAEGMVERQDEKDMPEVFQLTAREILCEVTDYEGCYLKVAQGYLESFNELISEFVEIPLELKWDSMVSPREYNFGTDRIFAHIPFSVVESLFAKSAADGHKRLAETLEANCTSYDGFSSHYSPELGVWLDKPLKKWDHNELGLLVLALMKGYKEANGNSWREDVLYHVLEGDVVSQAWSESVDWPKYEALVAKKYAAENPQ